MPFRTRGYLPHHDHLRAAQHLIFRLADSLPASLCRSLVVSSAAERLARVDKSLDAGIGSCALASPEIAATAQAALLHFEAERYHLLAWCIMPTHDEDQLEHTATYIEANPVAAGLCVHAADSPWSSAR